MCTSLFKCRLFLDPDAVLWGHGLQVEWTYLQVARGGLGDVRSSVSTFRLSERLLLLNSPPAKRHHDGFPAKPKDADPLALLLSTKQPRQAIVAIFSAQYHIDFVYVCNSPAMSLSLTFLERFETISKV